MKLIITDLSSHAVLVAFAETSLDAGNVKQFREAIGECIEKRQVLVLDMGELAFVDSSGLGALLSCLRIMNSKQGTLRLFGISKPVMALLELVRMHRLFAIYGSREEAVDDIASA